MSIQNNFKKLNKIAYTEVGIQPLLCANCLSVPKIGVIDH